MKAVRSLSWSSSSLTHSVRSYAEKVDRMIALPVPKLCRDVRSWAGAGFTVLSAATKPFDSAFLASWVSPGFLPSGLQPYERRLGAHPRPRDRKAGKQHRANWKPARSKPGARSWTSLELLP